jgi:hypothetical protein
MSFFVSPSNEEGSFGIFTLASGLIMKLPVILSGAGTGIQETFRANRHLVTGPVPVRLTDLANNVGEFWYSQKSGELSEYMDLRNMHVIKGNIVDGVEVNIDDRACINNDRWIIAPEFSYYALKTSSMPCPTETISARHLNAWIKVGSSGINEVALPHNQSFQLITILNMISIAFYLLITVGSFKGKTLSDQPLLLGPKICRTLCIVIGASIVYISSYDMVRDTKCTETEAAIVAAPITLFFMLLSYGFNIKSAPFFDITNTMFVLFSSVSLSLSVVGLDYINTSEPYSLVAMIANGIAMLITIMVMTRGKSTSLDPRKMKTTITKYERAIVEIAIISSLRVLVHHQLGELFALGTAGTVAIIVSKYCFEQVPIKLE